MLTKETLPCINIPTEFGLFVLRKKLVKPFKLYLLLRNCSSGIISKGSIDNKLLCRQLNIKEKSLKRRFNTLIALNWIGFCNSKKIIFLRSIKKLQLIHLGSISRQNIVFKLKDIDLLEEILFCGYIKIFIKRKKFKNRQLDPELLYARSSLQGSSCFNFRYSHNMITISTLAKIFKMSSSTIFKLKEKSKLARLLLVKENYLTTEIPGSEYCQFINNYPELKGTKINKGYIMVRMSDSLFPIISLKKVKKRIYN